MAETSSGEAMSERLDEGDQTKDHPEQPLAAPKESRLRSQTR
jgi:hypothetical protein